MVKHGILCRSTEQYAQAVAQIITYLDDEGFAPIEALGILRAVEIELVEQDRKAGDFEE